MDLSFNSSNHTANMHSDDDDDALSSLSESDAEGNMLQFKTKDSSAQSMSITQRAEMIHLRSFLNRMQNDLQAKTDVISGIQRELQNCRQHLERLATEKAFAESKRETDLQLGNMASVFKLDAQLKRIEAESAGDQQLEQFILRKLDVAEQSLTVAKIEQGKFQLAELNLEEQETEFKEAQQTAAIKRFKKEDQFAEKTRTILSNHQREQENKQKQLRQQDKELRGHIKMAHEQHRKHFDQTITRIRGTQEKLDKEKREEFETKMKSVLKLQTDILRNRENMKALQARDQDTKARALKEEQTLVEKAKEAGSDALLVKKKYKRQLEFDLKKKEFDRVERDREVLIAAKINMEDKFDKQKKKLLPWFYNESIGKKPVKTHKNMNKEIEKYLNLIQHEDRQANEMDYLNWEKRSNAGDSSDDNDEYTDNPDESEARFPDPDSTTTKQIQENKPDFGSDWKLNNERSTENDSQLGLKTPLPTDILEDIASKILTQGASSASQQVIDQPELGGIWEKDFSKQGRALAEASQQAARIIKNRNASQMEEAMMNRVLNDIRENIVQPQIVAGKRFEGVSSFSAKPNRIFFKDLQVDEIYQQKIMLTNVSYTINYIKFTGLSENLKDFVLIDFHPPGQLSAGMTCEFTVTFAPKLNLDITGEVFFLTQTGPLSVPIECYTKKFIPTVDRHQIEFGTTVIGEKLTQRITLTNHGARGAFYTFSPFSLADVEAGNTDLLSEGDNITGKDENDTDQTTNQAEQSQIEDTSALEDPTDGAEQTQSELSSSALIQGVGNDADIEIITAGTNNSNVSMNVMEESKRGFLQAHSSTSVELVWSPEFPEVCQETFRLHFYLNDPEEIEKLPKINVAALPNENDEKSEIIFSSVDSDRHRQYEQEMDVQHTNNTKNTANFIELHAFGQAVEVPVWVERLNIDMGICQLDRLYQDTILIHNRASTALKLQFDVPAPLANQVEILPKTGYIQARSSFQAQLKFVPNSSLLESGTNSYILAYDYSSVENTEQPRVNQAVLDVPLSIRVSQQTRPVNFAMQSVVTITDLSLSISTSSSSSSNSPQPPRLNFGPTTIYETTVQSIVLTNHSLLPQKFGFVQLPDYIQVQPNDGFGVILPEERIQLDVMFSPDRADEYEFELICRTEINRNFRLGGRGLGVHPPLFFSPHSVIRFPPVAIDAAPPGIRANDPPLYLVNDHRSTNRFTHQPPRIGKEPIIPVGPMTFEFVLPEDAPITINPRVGTVKTGERQRIDVFFRAALSRQQIAEHALQLIGDQRKNAAQTEWESAVAAEKQRIELEMAGGAAASDKKPAKKASTPAGTDKKKGGGNEVDSSGQPQLSSPLLDQLIQQGPQVNLDGLDDPNKISADSNEFALARSSLVRNFSGSFQSFSVPCHIAIGGGAQQSSATVAAAASAGDSDGSVGLEHRWENCVYLELHCPVVRPSLICLSNYGRTDVDFGQICIGQRKIQSITIQNISGHRLEKFESTMLHPNGSFTVLNALRPLEHQQTHTICVEFTPLTENSFHETWMIGCHGRPESSITFKLLGQGKVARIQLTGLELIYPQTHARTHGIFPAARSSIDANAAAPGKDKQQQQQRHDGVPEDPEEAAASAAAAAMLLQSGRGVWDLGGILANEYMEASFQLVNPSSSHSIDFEIRLASTERLLTGGDAAASCAVDRPWKCGTQNENAARSVFNVVPVCGRIPARSSALVTLTFYADHVSDNFADFLEIRLFKQQIGAAFQVRGQAKQNIMYLLAPPDDDDDVTMGETRDEQHDRVESGNTGNGDGGAAVGDDATHGRKNEEVSEFLGHSRAEQLLFEAAGGTADSAAASASLTKNRKVAIFLKAKMNELGEIEKAENAVWVGCVRTMAVSQKKNGEFSFDNIGPISQLGFSIDPIKSQVEANKMKRILITWTPPSNHPIEKMAEASINITLRCDATETIELMLKGMIVH